MVLVQKNSLCSSRVNPIIYEFVKFYADRQLKKIGHPALLSTSERLIFLAKLSDLLKDDKRYKQLRLARSLETKENLAFIAVTNQRRGLHKSLVFAMWYYVDYTSFGRNGVQALIRVIRNAYRHIDGLKKECRRLVTKECMHLFQDTNGLEKYIGERYPYLFIIAFNAVLSEIGYDNAH